MKKILFLSLSGLLVLFACKKDSLGTKPVISFKSYASNPIDISVGTDLTVLVSDGDGDIENQINFAGIYDANPTDTPWTSRPMPGLEGHSGGKISDAEVVLHLQPIDFTLETGAKDSIHYVIYVLDNAGNSSDTIVTPKVLIESN